MTPKRAPSIVHSYTSFFEYECCGDPVSVNDVLDVDHIPMDRRDTAICDLMPLDWYVGHHALGGPDDPGTRSRVRVKRLWEVYLHYRFDLARDAYVPIPGSGSLREVPAMRFGAVDDDMPVAGADYRPTSPQGWIMRLEQFGS